MFIDGHDPYECTCINCDVTRRAIVREYLEGLGRRTHRAGQSRGTPVCEHRSVTTSAGPFCEKCGAEL